MSSRGAPRMHRGDRPGLPSGATRQPRRPLSRNRYRYHNLQDRYQNLQNPWFLHLFLRAAAPRDPNGIPVPWEYQTAKPSGAHHKCMLVSGLKTPHQPSFHLLLSSRGYHYMSVHEHNPGSSTCQYMPLPPKYMATN